MFTLRTTGRALVTRPSTIRPVALKPQTGAAPIGRRYVQQGYGDDADKSIADTPEARQERSGEDRSSKKQESGGNESKQAQNPSDSGTQKTSSSKGTSGPQPKILSDSPPRDGEEPEDVKRHNEELRKRADNAHEKVSDKDLEKDKVGKGFWSGTGGVDRDP